MEGRKKCTRQCTIHPHWWTGGCYFTLAQKSTLAFKGGRETQETIWWFQMVSWVSPCLSFFPERLHCYYMYSYYNSSPTFCIKCWDSAFRPELQHFILRFNKISLLLVVRGLKEAQRQGDFSDISNSEGEKRKSCCKKLLLWVKTQRCKD
jgi:hypothetical protein